MNTVSPNDNFVIYDLEWNLVYSRTRRANLNEIIEIGAVKTDYRLNVIDTFRLYVHPVLSKNIGPQVKQLTNISAVDLEFGLPCQKAIKHFKNWCGSYAIFCSWGPDDVYVLGDNCRYFDRNYSLRWLNRYIDLRQFCADITRKDPNQYGLKRAADLLKVEYEGDKLHRALEDAKLLTQVFQKIVDYKKIVNYIKNGAEQKPIKAEYITNIKDPRINRGKFRFNCPYCGRFVQKVENWTVKKKKFRGYFKCERCSTVIRGKVAVGLVNDELFYKKAVEVIEPVKSQLK